LPLPKPKYLFLENIEDFPQIFLNKKVKVKIEGTNKEIYIPEGFELIEYDKIKRKYDDRFPKFYGSIYLGIGDPEFIIYNKKENFALTLGINKNKFLSFYPGRIEYNKSSANHQETIVTKKSIDMTRIDKVAIYKFVDFAVEEFSYDKNIGTFKKLILTAFSWILYLMDLICFAVLRLSGRIKSINLYVLIFFISYQKIIFGLTRLFFFFE